jgi:hypothetical protein
MKNKDWLYRVCIRPERWEYENQLRTWDRYQYFSSLEEAKDFRDREKADSPRGGEGTDFLAEPDFAIERTEVPPDLSRVHLAVWAASFTNDGWSQVKKPWKRPPSKEQRELDKL